MRKIAIVGAGAIGGFLGARLAAAANAQVSALARGATLDALRRHGWRLETNNGPSLQAPLAAASDNATALGLQDLVIVALKAHALPAVAPTLAPLLGPHTVVLPAMNGVPWWFVEGMRLESVDPGGRSAGAIPLDSVLGCVVHASCSVVEPGCVRHHGGQRLIVGEPRGGHSVRAQAVSDLLAQAGFELTLSADVRQDIWYKLWGNMTMNPVSALTGATVDRVLADPLVREFCSAAMREAAAIGERIGCPIAQDPEARHAVTEKLGAFKPSMLQDVEAGRPIELDALVGALREIAQAHSVATPAIDILFGLSRLHGRVRGLYPTQSTQGLGAE
jgi:2-dehydropantoate 2-reductase